MSTIPKDENPIIGNCGKHPGQSMINCPICEIEAQALNNRLVPGFHAVQYANYFNIQPSPFYGDKSILDSEDVGEEQAKMYAELIAKLLNEHLFAGYQLATDGREQKKHITVDGVEEIYDSFANWYHDDGEYDNFRRSETMQSIEEYIQSSLKEKDLIIHGLEEGSQQWEQEYKDCRKILEQLVEASGIVYTYGSRIEGTYQKFPELLKAAKEFLSKYQHQ